MPKVPTGAARVDLRAAAANIARAGAQAISRTLNAGALYMDTWMSPGSPLPVVTPQSPQADVVGRRMQYPVGYNLTITPRANEPVTFAQLRFLSDNCDILRTVIETRKDQMERLKWQVVPVEGTEVQADDPRIKEIEAFFLNPCTEGNWQYWMRAILEDLLVVDGISVYKRRRNDGSLFSLDLINPDTIKLLIDGTGRRPQPPEAAYQQVLYGVPAANYEAAGGEVDPNTGEGYIPFTSHEMIYRMRNPRTGRIYGFSPVEQIIMTVNIAIRRQYLQLAYYTAGNIPDMLLSAPNEWTPEQIQTYQEWWDEMLSDNLADRRKMRLVPGGSKPFPTTTEPQKDEKFDEWLARVVCFAFSISPQAFVNMMNRATSEVSKSSGDEEGLQPLKEFMKAMVDEIIAAEWGPDFEFSWKDTASFDSKEEAERAAILVKAGIKTRDQVRVEMGDDPLGGEASRLAVDTSQGPVLIATDLNSNGEKVVPTPAEEAAAAATQQLLENGGEPKTPEDGAEDDLPNPAPGDDKDPEAKKEAAATDTAGMGKKHPAGQLGFMAEGHNANAVAALTPKLTSVLADTGKSVAEQVRGMMAKADEDPEEKAAAIAEAVVLTGLAGVGLAVQEEVIGVFRVENTNTLLSVGVSNADQMFNQVNDAAVSYAQARGAELVTEITATTRKWLRDLITEKLQDATGVDALADAIAKSRSFSAARAALIAETEVGIANGAASYSGLVQAEGSGVQVKKEWLVADAPCPTCTDNAAAGPIPVNKPFPSGDLYPLAHPRCRCAVAGVTK